MDTQDHKSLGIHHRNNNNNSNNYQQQLNIEPIEQHLLHLPPPSPQQQHMSCASSESGVGSELTGESVISNVVVALNAATTTTTATTNNDLANNQNNRTSPTTTTIVTAPPPSASDFDSDTELSIVAAAVNASNTPNCNVVGQNTTITTLTSSTTVTTTIINNNNNNNNAALNAKQQRQQKRRRERAQRLQAERDNRSGGVAGAGVGAGGVMLYHVNSGGSMGEDSNNSNGNFTSSSNGSNNNNSSSILPPTDSIASLLLNPPHSPDCNSGLMASPSDSEGESLDEDLLSTSSSSTLLLPRDKPPPRPPPPVRRKIPRSPLLQEEIIDGFAILEFKSYEDLEFAIKFGQKRKEKRLSALDELTCTYSLEDPKMPKILDTGQSMQNMRNLGAVAMINHHHHHHQQQQHNTTTSTITSAAATINNNNNNNSTKDNVNNNNNNNNNNNSSNNTLLTALSTTTTTTTNTTTIEMTTAGATSTTTAVPIKIIENNMEFENKLLSSSWKDQYQTIPIPIFTTTTTNATTTNTTTAPTISNHNGGINTNGDSHNRLSTNLSSNNNNNTNRSDSDGDCVMQDSKSNIINVKLENCASENKHSNNLTTVTVTATTTTTTATTTLSATIKTESPHSNTVSSFLGGNALSAPYSGGLANNRNKSSVASTTTTTTSNVLGDSFRTNALLSDNLSVAKNNATTTPYGSTEALPLSGKSLNNYTATHMLNKTNAVYNNKESVTPELRGLGPTGHQHKDVEMKECLNDPNNSCNNIGKGFIICDSGNDENKNSDKLGPIVFPSTPTQHVPNATPSPTTPRKSSDYPLQATAGINSSPPTATSTTNANSGNGGAATFSGIPKHNENYTSQTSTTLQTLAPTSTSTATEQSHMMTSTLTSTSSGFASPAAPTASTTQITTTITSIAVSSNSLTQQFSPMNQLSNDMRLSSGNVMAGSTTTPTNSNKTNKNNNNSNNNNNNNYVNRLPTHANTPNLKNESSAVSMDTMKGVGVPLSTHQAPPPPPSPQALASQLPPPQQQPPPTMNGFLPAYAVSSGSQSFSRISPHAINTMGMSHSMSASTTSTSSNSLSMSKSLNVGNDSLQLPPPPPSSSTSMHSVVSGANSANIPTSHHSSVFAGVPSLGLGPGLPMGGQGLLTGGLPSNGMSPLLLHSSPYRPPYHSYPPLYAPYGGLPPHAPPPHNAYMSAVSTIPSPSASPRSSRMGDSNKPSNNVMRPPTPVSSAAPSLSVSSASPASSVTPTSSSHMLQHHMPPPYSHMNAPMNIPGTSMGSTYVSNVASYGPASTTTTAALSGSGMLRDPLTNALLPPPTSHLLATHPHMAPPHMLSHAQHPGLLRGPSPISSSSAPVSCAPTISSSVIQRVISPKCESPSNKERLEGNTSYNNNSTRSLALNSQSPYGGPNVSHSLVPPTLSGHMSVSYATVASLAHSSTTTTMATPAAGHSLTGTPTSLNYPPTQKPALWTSAPLQLAPPPTVPLTTMSSNNSNHTATRPTPPPTLSIGNSALSTSHSPQTQTHSTTPTATSSAPTGVSSTFPAPYFVAPLPPPPATSIVPATIPSLSTSTALPTSASPLSSHSTSSMLSTTTTVATNTPLTTPTQSTAPHPFSAESLFQTTKTDQADLLRRELDSRFLDRSGLTVAPPPPPVAQPPPPPHSHASYMRQEMHHHQHTHLHQHQPIPGIQTAAPPAPAPIFPPPPLFKDIPKIASVESPFYRGSLGLPAYSTGYSSAGLLHPGLGGPTPFMPPNHLTSFAPKKTGRWNAMHVRIAWEIYYHQNKQNPDKSANPGSSVPSSSASTSSASGVPGSQSGPTATSVPPPSMAGNFGMKASPSGLSLGAPPSHMLHRPGELPPGAAYASALPGRSPFETSPLSTSFIGAPPSHIGTSVSPFGRYVGAFGFTGLSPFAREIPLSSTMHDPWRLTLQRSVPPYHPAGAAAWAQLKPDPALDTARREAEEREREREMREREQRERDRQRREREERERKEKEEKLKREQQEREREREQREQRERERKERERREMERRELERERMLQQQRINENQKLTQQQQALSASPRDRSPHRSVTDMQGGQGGQVGGPNPSDIRIKEEPHPRTKEEQDVMMMRASAAAAAAAAADPRYHPSLAAAHHASFMAGRHGPHVPPPPHLARSMLPPSLGGPPLSHFGPPGPPAWALDPYRDPYAPMLRYNPLMEALRHEEERHKAAMSMYAAQTAAHMRAKEPSPIPPPSVGGPLGPPPPVGPPQQHHRIQASPLSNQQPSHTPPSSKPSHMGGMQPSHHGMMVDGMHIVPKKETQESLSPANAQSQGR